MVKFTATVNLTSTLLEKIWTTVVDNGLAWIFRPLQIKRIGKAETDVRAKEIITFAQAEKHAADIKAGKKQLLPDGTIVDARPIDDEQEVFKALEDYQRALVIERSLNIVKTIGYLMGDELPSEIPVSDDVVSRDWFTHWRMHAENYSEEHYQRLWAAVLAGEVRQPGSFSTAAMNILASISLEEARIFQQLCNMSFNNGDRTIILLTVPGWHEPSSNYSLTGSSTTMGEQLVDYGIEHFHLLSMRTVGLLASLPEEEYPEWDILLGEGVDYTGRPVTLQSKVKEGRVNVISFTEAGHQLRGLIDKNSHETYTLALHKLFEEASVVMKFV